MEVRIRQVARANGKSLYKIAREIGELPQTVYNWANGKTKPSYEGMDKLCEALDCTTGELFVAERR